MKLELLVPPSAFLINPMAFPPLGVLYVAAAAEAAGADVRVTDLSVQARPEWDPDLVGVSALTPHVRAVRDLLPSMPVPVILGGAHFDVRPEDYLRVGASAVSRGDGEATITQFLRGARGVLTGKVDDWPMPARHLIDLSRYSYTMDRVPTTSMVTSRGCPFSCAYCCRTSLARSVRLNPIERVHEEVEAITHLGYRGIMLYDDELNIDIARLAALCDVMRHARVTWRGFVRADLFTEAQARMCKESGCYELCAGVESASDAILKGIGKGARVEDATRCRHICRDYGIRFKAFMVIGLPGETEDTVKATEAWLLAERPDDFDLAPFVPFPGSRIMENPAAFDIQVEVDHWTGAYWYKGRPGEYQAHVSTAALSADRLRVLRDDVYARVKGWPAS